jgi:hypothetical protein
MLTGWLVNGRLDPFWRFHLVVSAVSVVLNNTFFGWLSTHTYTCWSGPWTHGTFQGSNLTSYRAALTQKNWEVKVMMCPYKDPTSSIRDNSRVVKIERNPYFQPHKTRQ